MIKVGLTGGIGSGKTTVASMFDAMGVPVYNADNRAKYLMRSNQELKQKIKKLLGNKAYYKNGYPNRPFIASLVFNNQGLLSQLNELIHPAVKDDLLKWFNNNNDHAYCLYESAILFESKSFLILDSIITVSAPEKLRIQRVMKRDKTTVENIRNRIENQMTDEERCDLSDYIIYNGTSDSLKQQIIDLNNIFIEKSI